MKLIFSPAPQAWLYALLFNALLLKPAGEGPSLMLFEHMDKLIHFSGHFLLATLFIRAYPNKMPLVILLLLGQALASEWLQKLAPGRSFEYFDILANTLGVLSGIIFSRYQRANLFPK